MGDVLRHQIGKLRGTQCDLVILIAGANDLRYTGDRIVFARRFRALLQATHDAAPQARVIVGGMPDVTQTAGVHPLMKAAISRLCGWMNETMRRTAAQFGDGFIDLYRYTNAPLYPDREYLCDDGYHPNDFGYAEIAERSLPAIWEVLRSPDTATTASPDGDSAETPTLS
jgi:lysophospholipase L1-like esterase